MARSEQGLDGGRIAAHGFQYQYLRTLETLLGLLENPAMAAVWIEGHASGTSAEKIDFSVVGSDGQCLVVQPGFVM